MDRGTGKYETAVTLANGGNHSPKQTRLAWQWIDACSGSYKPSARLYHLAFVMADREFQFHRVQHIYQAVLKGFRRYLAARGIRSSYQAARELDNDKGEHLHVFLCIEATNDFRVESFLNRKNGWLVMYAATKGVKIFINAPKNPMHSGLDYATLPRTKPFKVADAKIWISYIYKRRSKPKNGEVYSCSKSPTTIREQQSEGYTLAFPILDQAVEAGDGLDPLVMPMHTRFNSLEYLRKLGGIQESVAAE